MEKLLLVDGSNLLFQMFFGMPARIVNGQGKAIQGTLGFIGALLKIIRMVKPTHVAVLFDGECCNPRREIDSAYKADREDYSQVEEDENPFSQLPDILTALDYMGIRYAETINCETDDWMAGYALEYGKEREIVIASHDSDFFQLISDRVRILRYRGEKTTLCDMDFLRQKLGILPSQYAGHKSLTGDSADNIKGVPKIGPKTATWLMNRFGTLENLLEHGMDIENASVRDAIVTHQDRVRKNYQLIQLENTVPLPFLLPQLVYQDSNMTTAQVLHGIGLR